MKNQPRQSRSKRTSESKKIEIIEENKKSKKRYPQYKINNTGTHTKIRKYHENIPCLQR